MKLPTEDVRKIPNYTLATRKAIIVSGSRDRMLEVPISRPHPGKKLSSVHVH